MRGATQPPRVAHAIVGVVAAAVTATACTYDIPDLADGSAARDGSAPSRDGASEVESGVDGGAPPDSGGPASDATTDGDGAPPPPPVYSNLGDLTKWQTFDTSVATGSVGSFAGGTFDGRYVYFAPSGSTTSYGVVPRFDTSVGSGFQDKTAWAAFDVTGLMGSPQGFIGALYDGARYVYFTPYAVGTGTPDGVVARYDTQGAFQANSGWSSFDTTTVAANSQGYSGEAFDGRYLYLAPSTKGSGSAPNGLVARLDTQATLSSGWTTFPTNTLDPSAEGFFGAVFDGRYVTFIPDYGSVAVRYDTTQPDFNLTSSWESFDTSTVAGQLPGFSGGVFDGRYIYLVPGAYLSSMGDTFLSNVVRFDTQGSFAAASSWTSFDASQLAPGARGFEGGAFDGRYVYFVPNSNGASSPNQFVFDGVLVRYDTTTDFQTPASWGTFDTTTLSASPKGFIGAVFDGEYLYLIPSASSVAARFDAKTPRSMPALPQFQGSFL